jgi:hypothetical protein
MESDWKPNVSTNKYVKGEVASQPSDITLELRPLNATRTGGYVRAAPAPLNVKIDMQPTLVRDADGPL